MKSLNHKVVILTVLILANASFAGTYSGGTGEPNSPYKISVVADWQELMTTPADWNKCFLLTADINLAGISLNPVGSDCGQIFFDGNGHVIRNATINQPSNDSIGMFGIVGSGSQIRNLGVENVNITGQSNVGGLVGHNRAAITNCYATGSVSVTGGRGYVGGLVGCNDYSGQITLCYSTGSVSGTGYVGGLVGYNSNQGQITLCYSTGSVSGCDNVGGLVGYIINSTLTSCYATGSVSGRDYVGGLVGYCNSAYSTTSCYSTGSVSGRTCVGGLVGCIIDSALTSCYATGSVTGTDEYGEYIGGLAGYNRGAITACFWDIQTSGKTTSAGGTGLTTAAMYNAESYLRSFWDFKGEMANGTLDVWAMPPWDGYPVLAWQLGDSPVSNDEIEGAIPVTVGLTISGSSVRATGLDITLNGYKDDIDVWYVFTAPSDGDYVIGTLGSNFDTTLAVFDEAFVEIVFNDDYNCKQSELTLKATAGVKYYIRIAGYNGQTGDYRLSVKNAGSDLLMGDLNGDGEVDTLDFAMFVSHWLEIDCNESNNWCEGADITGDGVIDFQDYAVLAENWTGKIIPPFPPADYYVDPNGNDSNLGTSPEQAWKTIQKAVDTVQAGNTVVVMPGTYAEQVTTVNAGTDGSPITYRGWYEKGAVIINATGKAYGFKNTKAYVILDGFEVINANQNGILFSNDSGDNCIIRNCVSRNNGTNGIKIDSSDNCLIENCLIYNNIADGVEVTGNADATYFNNCTIYSNGKDGIGWSTSDGTVNNCIIVNNGWWGLSSYGTMTVNIYYSDIWNNIKGHYDNTSKIIEGDNCIHSDPLFIAPSSGDFNLQSGSPCKNTASDGGDMGYR